MKQTSRRTKLAAFLLAGLFAAQLLPLSAAAKDSPVSSPMMAQNTMQMAAVPSFTPLYRQEYGIKSIYEYSGPSLLTNSNFENNSLAGWQISGNVELEKNGEQALTTCLVYQNSSISQTYLLPPLQDRAPMYSFKVISSLLKEPVTGSDFQLQLEVRDAAGKVIASSTVNILTILSFDKLDIRPPLEAKTLTVRAVNTSNNAFLKIIETSLYGIQFPDQLNLISGGDFTSLFSFFGAAGWSTSNIFNVKYTTETGARDPVLDSRAMEFPTGDSFMYQTIPLNGKAGDRYDYAMWAKAAAKAGGVFAMTIEIPKADGSGYEEISRYNFSNSNTNWQYGTKQFTLPRDCANVRMNFLYKGQVSPAWVDGAQLFRQQVIPNALENGGFENGMSGWISRGNPCSFITTAQAHSGTQSAYFGYFANEPMNNYLEQSYASDKGGGTYTLSAYVKADATLSGAGLQLVLEAKGATENIIAVSTSPTVADTGGGWQKVSVTLKAPISTKSVTAKIGGLYCTGAFYVDDAQLSYQS